MERSFSFNNKIFTSKESLSKAMGCSKKTLSRLIQNLRYSNFTLDETQTQAIFNSFQQQKEKSERLYVLNEITYTNVDELLDEINISQKTYRDWRNEGNTKEELQTEEGIQKLLAYAS